MYRHVCASACRGGVGELVSILVVDTGDFSMYRSEELALTVLYMSV